MLLSSTLYIYSNKVSEIVVSLILKLALLQVLDVSRYRWEQAVWQLLTTEHMVGISGSRTSMRYAIFDLVEAINYPQFRILREDAPALNASVTLVHFGNVHGSKKAQIMATEGWYMGDQLTQQLQTHTVVCTD